MPPNLGTVFVGIGFVLAALTAVRMAQRFRDGRRIALLGASLAFYLWLDPFGLTIAVATLVLTWLGVEFLAGRGISGPHWGWSLLVAADLGLLTFYKLVPVMPADWKMAWAMPLGLSFLLFRLISYVMDARNGGARGSLLDLHLYGLFFPAVIAGPLMRFQLFQRLLAASPPRLSEDMAVGVVLISMGLFKKFALAALVEPGVDQIFTLSDRGQQVSFVTAWAGALGYGLQVYFDFSGYSDMAVGAARLFGIRLPTNFNSPYKARCLVEFWQRWHISLTRFLVTYVYNPVAMTAGRWLGPRARPGWTGSPLPGFLALVGVPTLCTMVLIGVWHGMQWTYALYGLVQGVMLTINHLWRRYGGQRRKTLSAWRPWPWLCHLVTFVLMMAAWGIFRSGEVAGAVNMLSGLSGMAGLALPDSYADRLGSLSPLLQSLGVVFRAEAGYPSLQSLTTIFALLVVVLIAPNPYQILAKFDPVLTSDGFPKIDPYPAGGIQRLGIAGGCMAGLFLVAGLLAFLINDSSPFIYVRF